MSNLAAWILQGILAAFLQLRYPGMTAAWVEPVRRDPSYAVYENYRYAYERYGYLFSYAEEPDVGGNVSEQGGDGAGPDDIRKSETGTAGQGEAGAEWEFHGQAGNGEGVQTAQETEDTGPGTGMEHSAGAAEALARLQDYDYLMKHYFSVHASTTADRSLMRAEKLLGTDVCLEKNPSVPQILIYHTHATEAYADYGPEHPDATVTGMGTYLAELLRQRGWNVIHDTTAYDMKEGKLERSRAYTYALEGIQGTLQEHPSIEVIVDLHRDGVADSMRLVQEIEGKPTAKIMFFQGMSRTPEGEIAYLPNPNLEENLAFCFQLQMACARYPGFTRKIYLKGLRYNLHLRGRSALIEAGAQTNTSEEARNAMDLLAGVLDTVLQGD